MAEEFEGNSFTEADENDRDLFLERKNKLKREGGLRTKKVYKKSNKEKACISIITIVYNSERYLEETICSVVKQSYYDNIEYIVIDGGSTDGTVNIIRKYENKIDYWVSERDKGIAHAFNKGIAASSGEYLLMLNAGDSFVSRKSLEKIDCFLKDNPDILSFQALTDKGNKFPIYRNMKSKVAPNSIKTAIENALVAHQATLVKKDVYRKVGLYDITYKLRMDFDFFLRAQKKYSFVCINEPLVLYRTDGITSQLGNRWRFKMEEMKIINREYKNPLYMFYFWLGLPLYFFKRFLSYVYYKYIDIR